MEEGEGEREREEERRGMNFDGANFCKTALNLAQVKPFYPFRYNISIFSIPRPRVFSY